ncbi:hypothetical protein AB3R30_24775 [Leptolyngbyaceae cyanobacterium UHCC 1019]
MKGFRGRKRRWVWVLGSGLAAIALPTLLNLLPVMSPRAIATPPQILRECIPKDFPKVGSLRRKLTFKLVARTLYQSSEYRLYQVNQPNSSAPFPYVVKLRGKTCEGIYSNPMGDPDDYFHLAMPLLVARQLTLGRLQVAIQKAGGLQAFRHELRRTQKQYGQITEMAEEEVWAYQQVGLPLPPNMKIIRANSRL